MPTRGLAALPPLLGPQARINSGRGTSGFSRAGSAHAAALAAAYEPSSSSSSHADGRGVVGDEDASAVIDDVALTRVRACQRWVSRLQASLAVLADQCGSLEDAQDEDFPPGMTPPLTHRVAALREHHQELMLEVRRMISEDTSCFPNETTGGALGSSCRVGLGTTSSARAAAADVDLFGHVGGETPTSGASHELVTAMSLEGPVTPTCRPGVRFHDVQAPPSGAKQRCSSAAPPRHRPPLAPLAGLPPAETPSATPSAAARGSRQAHELAFSRGSGMQVGIQQGLQAPQPPPAGGAEWRRVPSPPDWSSPCAASLRESASAAAPHFAPHIGMHCGPEGGLWIGAPLGSQSGPEVEHQMSQLGCLQNVPSNFLHGVPQSGKLGGVSLDDLLGGLQSDRMGGALGSQPNGAAPQSVGSAISDVWARHHNPSRSCGGASMLWSPDALQAYRDPLSAAAWERPSAHSFFPQTASSPMQGLDPWSRS